MDHEYLKHLSEMDDTVLRDLMRSYGQDVWDYAYLLTRKFHLADDVTQDVFISAYRNIGSFRGDSSVRTWLLTIARNTALNYQRSAFMRRVVLFDWVAGKGTSSSAESEYLSKAKMDEVWSLVLRLPDKFREVLVLEARYSLPLTEISSLLGISVGTVKSRLHRARKRVSSLMKEAEAYETL